MPDTRGHDSRVTHDGRWVVSVAPNILTRAMAAVEPRNGQKRECLFPLSPGPSDVPRAQVSPRHVTSTLPQNLIDVQSSLAYPEMYLCLAKLVRRFECELFDVVRERDIDHYRDCFLGEPRDDSNGVRLRVITDRANKVFSNRSSCTTLAVDENKVIAE